MNQSTASKTYRRTVLPFAIFLLLGGVSLGIAAFVFPAYAIFLPPFEAEMTKRVVLFAIALFLFIMGVGFLVRYIWALYAFVGYVLIGTAWHVVAGLADPGSRWLLCSPLFNFPIAYVIYKATRPAFTSDNSARSQCESPLSAAIPARIEDE